MGHIAVIGAGSWGTGISVQLAKRHAVRLWEHDPGQVEAIRRDRENRKFLPGVHLPEGVEVSGDMPEVLHDADIVLFVVPSRYLRATARRAASCGLAGKHLVSLVKGLEQGTGKRMSQVLAEETGPCASLSVLSGPSHAEEVGRDIPTAVLLASERPDDIAFLAEELSTDTFRVYLGADVAGVEYCAATKNVIAIAAGVCDGLGLGANTKAALLTRGMEEIRRLLSALGCDERTATGLAGIGDLITTCISPHSRNRHVGERLGRGERLDAILASMVMVAEGVEAAATLRDLARGRRVEMPITESVCRVLFEDAKPADEVRRLMHRPLKREFA